MFVEILLSLCVLVSVVVGIVCSGNWRIIMNWGNERANVNRGNGRRRIVEPVLNEVIVNPPPVREVLLPDTPNLSDTFYDVNGLRYSRIIGTLDLELVPVSLRLRNVVAERIINHNAVNIAAGTPYRGIYYDLYHIGGYPNVVRPSVFRLNTH